MYPNRGVCCGMGIISICLLDAVQICFCFFQAFKREALEKDSEVTKRMLNIVRQLQANPEMFQACVSQLSQEQQVALHQYLTSGGPSSANTT